MIYGCDVSFHKGYPVWSLAKDKVSFAILGVTELHNGIDVTFNHNYDACHANGIAVGAYSYSYASNGRESRNYADLIVRHLGGRTLEMPVYLDLEWETQKSFGPDALKDIIEQFREGIEAGGYAFGGIYCNMDWYRNYIPAYAKEKYHFWIAAYPFNDNGLVVESLKPDVKNLVGWQYSENGRLPGFGDQGVDLDVWYADIPNGNYVPPAPTEDYPTLRYGNTGIAVEQLQALLNKYGAGIAVDGIYGYKTGQAVRDFQRENGLVPDGITGPLTWSSLLHGGNGHKSVTELAKEVLDGLWGNGEERKRRLMEAGYDYDAVQKEVNYLLEDM